MVVEERSLIKDLKRHARRPGAAHVQLRARSLIVDGSLEQDLVGWAAPLTNVYQVCVLTCMRKHLLLPFLSSSSSSSASSNRIESNLLIWLHDAFGNHTAR